MVAPSQTLSDREYHMLRTAAIKIVRHFGVIGECNVQYALNPNSLEFAVIEMNARLSRSSALASKATGYPLAYVAANIGLGFSLPAIQNSVTQTTTACFEPSLDYVVTKVPRWDLAKFQQGHVDRTIGSSMKSVGESMAIGRTFEESLQKALRQVDPKLDGFEPIENRKERDLDKAVSVPSDTRLFSLAKAMLDEGYSVDRLHEMTRIDKWFLYKLENLKHIRNDLRACSIDTVSVACLSTAKKAGFSDRQVGKLLNVSEDRVRQLRQQHDIVPRVKQIDTLAGEYPAKTNYLYMTYNADSDDISFDENGLMVLGSGVYRIGSSVEFDWCAVNCVQSLRALGEKTIMVNYNPETVSTDYDEADRLYFEELSYERVMDIYEKERASGVVVSVGGQLPQNMALRLHENQVRILGTDPRNIDRAENRFSFSQILDRIGVDQPAWKELTSVQSAKTFAEQVGYPCLVRPSYVLSGAAMNVALSAEELESFLAKAVDISPEHPVVMTKFIEGAQEIDLDGVAHQGRLLVHAISEHVEKGGVHSGDASLILPPTSLDSSTMKQMKEIAAKISKALDITGPFNMQILRTPDGALKVIECNVRASRSFPFVSKVLDYNFIDTATRAMMNKQVPKVVDLHSRQYGYSAVKVAQYSWPRLPGVDPVLGVEMGSTGEVACFGSDPYEAFYTAVRSLNGFRAPQEGDGILIAYDDKSPKESIIAMARKLYTHGYKVYATSTSPDGTSVISGLPHLRFAQERGRKEDMAQLSQYRISLVMHIGTAKTPSDFWVRRLAVDSGVPLMNNAEFARMFVDSMVRVETDLGREHSIKSWSDYLSKSANASQDDSVKRQYGSTVFEIPRAVVVN